ncbi:hypothetical protein B0H65DRAFT_562456 [Neurospora tetraspora]|uniref:Uncharacterized protein n=1 Tax=Neurospora tetraspora TaxID=94610 RepID=A0AAE0JN90_9PEZI|nr:hypothetical protein B0H65DRAFT_562456 [Neurospora tetraspora]
MSYSGSRYRPSGRQVAAPDDSRSRHPASSHHNAPSRTSQPSGGRGHDDRARSFPADAYLGYSSDGDDDDDNYYCSSSGRAPGGSSSSHRDPGHGRSRSYGGYDDYDADESDRGYGRGPSTQSRVPQNDHHGGGRNHPSSSSSHRDQARDHRDDERYYAPSGSSSSGRHHDRDSGYGRDYGRDSGPGGPSSRHGGEDMRGGDPRASESRREIPFRYVSPFDLGFGGGSRERGGGGGRSDPFAEDWDFPSRSSGHRRSSGRDDGWFSDGESDWSDGFW